MDGSFVRPDTVFRGSITSSGGEFPAQVGRYHLYVSLACPWAHRVLILHRLRRLEDIIGISVVQPAMGAEGWSFGDGDGSTSDQLYGERYLRDLYLRACPDYTGRVTVPVLWDGLSGRMVNNESREIVRMLGTAFRDLGDPAIDFCPMELRERIDAAIDEIYGPINNGVYRAGFSGSQAAYDDAVAALFSALDRLDQRLGRQRYLCGDVLTEADWFFFTTLIRFDCVYHGHFKCNVRRIVDYPHLWPYLRDLYQVPGVAETVDFDHIRSHYYGSHPSINPTGIVARGPDLDLVAPHGREALTMPCTGSALV